MINLIIKGGLGNQMFQYAFARYLQELYRKKGFEEQLMINPYFIQHRVIKDNDDRDMSLQHFALNSKVKILSIKEQKTLMKNFRIQVLISTPIIEFYRWRIKKIKKDSENLFSYRAIRGIYYTYTPYTEYIPPLSTHKLKSIFGFFQTEKNFRPISDIIKKEFLVKDIPSRENEEVLKQIQSCNAVCLHVRRGDYLNPRWKDLQICTFEYYNNAVNVIIDRIENPVFFVFSNTSDDIKWIRENYHFKDKNGNKKINIVYVDLNNPDYEELRLMYNCKHFIISNSSFSWWGAYLSSYPQKIVIAPERWNLSEDKDLNVYLDDWIKIRTT